MLTTTIIWRILWLQVIFWQKNCFTSQIPATWSGSSISQFRKVDFPELMFPSTARVILLLSTLGSPLFFSSSSLLKWSTMLAQNCFLMPTSFFSNIIEKNCKHPQNLTAGMSFGRKLNCCVFRCNKCSKSHFTLGTRNNYLQVLLWISALYVQFLV